MQRNNRQREAEAQLAINLDLDGVDPLAGELNSAEDMHIRGVGIEGRELKKHFAGGNGFLILGIEDRRVLGKFPDSPAPPRPEAKFKKSERNGRGRNHPDDANQSLLATRLLAHILTKDTRLQIGQNRFLHGAKLKRLP